MTHETREQRIRRIKEKLSRDRGQPNDGVLFGVEVDPDYFEAFSQVGWGFFNRDKPRHVPEKMRAILAAIVTCSVLWKKDPTEPGATLHCERALEHGATMEEILEAFEVAGFAGGHPLLLMGLRVLKEIAGKKGGLKEPGNGLESPRAGASSETREERVRRITEKMDRDRGYTDEALGFGARLDPDYFEPYSEIGWGFFNPDRPRHLPQKNREIIAVVVVALRGSEEDAYHHCKRALQHGSTMEEVLEAFEVSGLPGGTPHLLRGLRILKRIADEGGGLKDPIGGPGGPRGKRIRRITEKMSRDQGRIDEALGFGARLDPDYFEPYSEIGWGFFNPDKPGRFLPHKTRETIAAALMAFRTDEEGVAIHCKRALEYGATIEEMVEVFEVCLVPAGAGAQLFGLRALKRIVESAGASCDGGSWMSELKEEVLE